MGLGFEKRKTYLSIKDGKIQKKTATGAEAFDFVEGRLVNVATESVEFTFGDAQMLKLDIQDPETNEVYCLGMSLQGSVARSLLNSLSSAADFGAIHIRPYQNKAGYNAVYVTGNGERLSWAQQLPQRKADLKGNVDDSELREFTERMAAEVADKVRGARPAAVQAAYAGDDDVAF